MSWIELIVTFLLNPIRFPVGLIRIWLIEGKRKKTFRAILNERDFAVICGFGTVMFLDIIAALGAIAMLLMVIAAVISISRFGLTH